MSFVEKPFTTLNALKSLNHSSGDQCSRLREFPHLGPTWHRDHYFLNTCILNIPCG